MGAELPVWLDPLLAFLALSHEALKLLDALDQRQVLLLRSWVIWHLPLRQNVYPALKAGTRARSTGMNS